MTEIDIKTLGYRIYNAFNAREIAAAEELFAPNFVSHAAGTVGGVRDSLTFLFARYPDIHFVIEDVLVEGDKFALRMTIHGIPHAPEQPQPTLMEFFVARMGEWLKSGVLGEDCHIASNTKLIAPINLLLEEQVVTHCPYQPLIGRASRHSFFILGDIAYQSQA